MEKLSEKKTGDVSAFHDPPVHCTKGSEKNMLRRRGGKGSEGAASFKEGSSALYSSRRKGGEARGNPWRLKAFPTPKKNTKNTKKQKWEIIIKGTPP